MHGYEATSLDAVAARAGVTKGTVYYHFDSKEALYQAVLLSHTAEAAEKLETAVQTSSSSAAALDRIIEIAAAEAIDPKRRYIYYGEIVNIDPSIRETVNNAARRYLRVVSQVVARGQEAGEVIPGDPRILSQLLLGMIGRAATWYNPAGEVPPAELVEAFKTAIFGGFLTDAGRTRVDGLGRRQERAPARPGQRSGSGGPAGPVNARSKREAASP